MSTRSGLDTPSPSSSSEVRFRVTQGFQEALVEAVRGRPALWDPRHPLAQDWGRQDEVWAEVGNELNVPGNMAKSKWRNLRDTYRRQRKKLAEPNPVGKIWGMMQPMSFLDRFECLDRRQRRGEAVVAQTEEEYSEMLYEDEMNGEDTNDSAYYMPSKVIKTEPGTEVKDFFVKGMAMVTNLDESQLDSDIRQAMSQQVDLTSNAAKDGESPQQFLEVGTLMSQNSEEYSDQESTSRSSNKDSVADTHFVASKSENVDVAPLKLFQNNRTLSSKELSSRGSLPYPYTKRPRGRPRKRVKTEPIFHNVEESNLVYEEGEDRRDLVYAKYVANEVGLITDKDMLALAKYKIAQVLYAAQTGILKADQSLGTCPCLQNHTCSSPMAATAQGRNYPNIANTSDDPASPRPAESTSNLDSSSTKA